MVAVLEAVRGGDGLREALRARRGLPHRVYDVRQLVLRVPAT